MGLLLVRPGWTTGCFPQCGRMAAVKLEEPGAVPRKSEGLSMLMLLTRSRWCGCHKAVWLQHLAQAEIKVWVHLVHKASAADCKGVAQIGWWWSEKNNCQLDVYSCVYIYISFLYIYMHVYTCCIILYHIISSYDKVMPVPYMSNKFYHLRSRKGARLSGESQWKLRFRISGSPLDGLSLTGS